MNISQQYLAKANQQNHFYMIEFLEIQGKSKDNSKFWHLKAQYKVAFLVISHEIHLEEH